MQIISFIELRKQAKNAKVRGWGMMNKDELCMSLGIVRVEHEAKYVLKNTETGETSEWYSVHLLSKRMLTNPGNVFYALKKGRTLKIGNVEHGIRQVRF